MTPSQPLPARTEEMNWAIHPDTKLGYVHLTVRDLRKSLAFYEDALGFKIHSQSGGTARLGAGESDLLVLTENPSARMAARATGLYHFAILVPSRFHLAQSLRRIADTETQVQGFADHLVSEAIYLADIDGNGIEIYRDRPRTEWYDARGNLQMGTARLDVHGVLDELTGRDERWNGLGDGTVLGHMHLQIANVARDEAFYRDVLGFNVMANLGSASFVSAGGYHHHLGMNTWNSAGAPPPPPNAVGLRYFTMQLPTSDALSRTIDRVRRAGIAVEEMESGLLVRDPSHNSLVLKNN